MNPFRNALVVGLLGLGAVASATATAARVDFTIENLTHAITFRPFVLAAHGEHTSMFRAGQPASVALQEMAECGGVDAIAAQMAADGADVVANPVNEAKPFVIPLGLLFPAGTTELDPVVPFDAGLPGRVSGTLFTSRHNRYLSLSAMLLPTNDAFVGLDSFKLPKKGTVVLYLFAYDAGTEANNELAADDNPLDCVINEAGYPVDPLGNDHAGGSGVTDVELNDTVHVHRGQLGDTDPLGGVSNLDSGVHRWLNPVVKLTLTVTKGKRDRDDDEEDDD